MPYVDARILRLQQGVVTVVLLGGFVFSIVWLIPVAAVLPGLDAAFGRGSNAELLADVVGRLDVAVELSGGIRDDASLAAALATGCARVNIGTAALERPDWVRGVIASCGEKIAVGLDVRGERLAARGWTQEGGDLGETLARLDAIRREPSPRGD